MRFVIEDKTLVRCELEGDERNVEVEVPHFVERDVVVEGSYATVDYVERIGAGAFKEVAGRIARLVLPGHLRAVDEGAFAGLGVVGELVVYAYDDADADEMANDMDNPIACQRLTVLRSPYASGSRESFFDLCLVDDVCITEIEVDASVHVRYSPGHGLEDVGGFGLQNVRTLTYLLHEAYNVINPYLIMATEMRHNLWRLVFENCYTVYCGPSDEGRPSRCEFADGASLEDMLSLEEVVLPEGLERIGERLFSEDRNLRSVYVPLSVREIGPRAFWRCTNLEQLSIPEEALEGTSATAFVECPKLAMLEAVRPGADAGAREHATTNVTVSRWAAVTAVDRLVSAAEMRYPELREAFPAVDRRGDVTWDDLYKRYRYAAYNHVYEVADEGRAKQLAEIHEALFLLCGREGHRP